MLAARCVLKPGALRRQLAVIGAILGIGAAWGVVLGLWCIAPTLVDAHRLAPRAAGEWVVLVGAIVAMSAIIGALLSPFAGMLLALAMLVRRRPLASAWTALLFAAPAVATAYFAAAALVEWRVAGRSPLVMPDAYVGPAIGVAAVLAVAVVVHRLVRARVPPTAGGLLAALGVAVALGALALPFRVASRPVSTTSEAGPLVRGPSTVDPAPLLLVGIDSGNWDAIGPLVRTGALPTFGRLVAGGVQGEVEAMWPPYWSGPAWSAILTGHPREETGIFGDLAGFAPGLPPFSFALSSHVLRNPYLLIEWKLVDAGVIRAVPSPRTVLGRPPVWELLSRAGVRAGVVRMDFTHPPDGQADVVVSNHAGRDIWSPLRERDDTHLVWPVELQDELLAPFSDAVPFDADGYERIVPSVDRPRSARVSFELEALRRAYDTDRRSVEAAVALLRRRGDLQFLGVYLGGFDDVCHATWQYRFPDAYGDLRSPDADIREFGGVIDRYLEFLDAALGRLLAAFPREPNVIVVADHGHTASPEALDQPLWRGRHGRIGMFLAHGPGVPAASGMRRVSYFDVVPTIVALLGFVPPTGMHGASVVPSSAER